MADCDYHTVVEKFITITIVKNKSEYVPFLGELTLSTGKC